jgi:hypothetical protein
VTAWDPSGDLAVVAAAVAGLRGPYANPVFGDVAVEVAGRNLLPQSRALRIAAVVLAPRQLSLEHPPWDSARVRRIPHRAGSGAVRSDLVRRNGLRCWPKRYSRSPRVRRRHRRTDNSCPYVTGSARRRAHRDLSVEFAGFAAISPVANPGRLAILPGSPREGSDRRLDQTYTQAIKAAVHRFTPADLSGRTTKSNKRHLQSDSPSSGRELFTGRAAFFNHRNTGTEIAVSAMAVRRGRA